MADGIQLTLAHCRGLRTNPLVVSTQGVWQVAFWCLPRGEKKIYCHPPPSLTPHLGGTLKDGKAAHTGFVSSEAVPCTGKRLSFYQRAGQCGNLATQQHTARLPGWPAWWLCWPVTNSNCPHKKLQVAAPPFPRLPTYNL